MEEQEAPLEDVHEEIHHHAEHARERWVPAVALSTAVLAALAAIASLLSGDNVNEAMFEEMRALDHWNYYQAQGIKANELESRIQLLESNHAPAKDQDRQKLATYRERQEHASEEARGEEDSAKQHMKRHHTIAKSVTFSQIAIAVCAISVLTRQRWFWAVGLAFGCAGLGFLVWGLMV